MTIHPVRMNGMIIGVPQVFDYFDKMQDRIVAFIAQNSNINERDFKKLMFETKEIANDVGTVLFGEETVKHGIIDSVGTVHDALTKLHEMIGEKKEKEK